MTPDKLNRLWLLATGILIIIILSSSLVFWLRRDDGQEVIFLSPTNTSMNPTNVVIEGAVVNPGSYPLRADDTISDIIKASGGFNQNADLSNIKIVVPETEPSVSLQKVDINRADLWLLQALPAIGEVRAQSIIDYRVQNGSFKNIEEIMKVPGLNQSTFDKIKEFITISE